MSASLYLEHYLESIEGLPFEMQRIFTLVRELDSKTQDVLKEVDRECERYEEDVASLQMAQRDSRLKEIDALYVKAKEYADEKVALATQTYDTIDKHIKRLDSDLARFQADLRDKESRSGSRSSELLVQKPFTEISSRKRSRHSKKDSDKKSRRKKQKTSPSVHFPVVSATAPSPLTEMTLDMPVDPNEPTYCICQQVSYGEMVGCDNMDCPIEWFHFQCVGLTEKPKGKWYCSRCSLNRKKKHAL